MRDLRTESRTPAWTVTPVLEKVLEAREIHIYKESCIYFYTSELEEESSRKEMLTLAAGCQLLTSAASALLPVSGGLRGLRADVADLRVNVQNPERSGNLQRGGSGVQVKVPKSPALGWSPVSRCRSALANPFLPPPALSPLQIQLLLPAPLPCWGEAEPVSLLHLLTLGPAGDQQLGRKCGTRVLVYSCLASSKAANPGTCARSSWPLL